LNIAPSLRGGTTKQPVDLPLIKKELKKTPPNRMMFSIVQKQKLEIRFN